MSDTRFHLRIEQTIENPNYATEIAEWREKQRYRQFDGSNMSDAPQQRDTIKVLEVEVTDVEFAAIKKAALATMA